MMEVMSRKAPSGLAVLVVRGAAPLPSKVAGLPSPPYPRFGGPSSNRV